jgi:hypothetical protein
MSVAFGILVFHLMLRLEKSRVHRYQSSLFLLHIQVFDQPSPYKVLNIDDGLEVLLLEQNFVVLDDKQRSAAPATIRENLYFTSACISTHGSEMRDESFSLGSLEEMEDVLAFACECTPVAIYTNGCLVIEFLEVDVGLVDHYFTISK